MSFADARWPRTATSAEGGFRSLQQVNNAIVSCEQCPELRAYCAEVAKTKRRAYADHTYWGQPVPGFGDRRANIFIIGLAPGAHGANRSGRMFTGDRSGDFLYAALHRAELANQPTAEHIDDGLCLRDVYIGAALRCAPPGNRPTSKQLDICRGYLLAEFRILKPRVVLCLGGIAWKAGLRMLDQAGFDVPQPRPKFAHGAEIPIDGLTFMGCYHVSQQNTFTGRLTEQMLDQILANARTHAD